MLENINKEGLDATKLDSLMNYYNSCLYYLFAKFCNENEFKYSYNVFYNVLYRYYIQIQLIRCGHELDFYKNPVIKDVTDPLKANQIIIDANSPEEIPILPDHPKLQVYLENIVI